MPDSSFKPNRAGLKKLEQALIAATKSATNAAYDMIKEAGQEYRRRLERVVPRDTGALARSWQVVNERTETTLSTTVGTNQKGPNAAPYPALLEIGADAIAGCQVQDWKRGEPPILEWPAKLARLAAQKPRTAIHDDTLEQQLPFLRPVGYAVAPEVADNLCAAISSAHKPHLDRQKF